MIFALALAAAVGMTRAGAERELDEWGLDGACRRLPSPSGCALIIGHFCSA